MKPTLLTTASAQVIDMIESAASMQDYKKKQLVSTPGKPLKDVLIVKSGYLKVYTVRGDKEIILDILQPGDYLLPAQFSGADSFIESLTSVEVQKLPYAKFEELLAMDPALALSIISDMAWRLEQSRLKIANIGSGNAASKVYDELSRLCQVIGSDSAQGYRQIDTRFSHQQIADMVGLTRESVTHALMKLKAQGQIKVESGAILVNMTSL